MIQYLEQGLLLAKRTTYLPDTNVVSYGLIVCKIYDDWVFFKSAKIMAYVL